MMFDFGKAAREAQASGFEFMLDFMRLHGSSVILNWGEDDEIVECSWISGGDRFTGTAANWHDACWRAIEKCLQKTSEVKDAKK